MAVHRFKANEAADADSKTTAPKVTSTKKSSVAKKKVPTKDKVKREKKPSKLLAPFRAFAGYFVGSWRELRQVHWPNRKQTWALTLAVILFSLGLGAIIFLLDLAFTFIFKKIF